MIVEYKYRASDKFKNLKLGDVFEFDYKLYIKIDFTVDDGNCANAFEVLNNYKAYFKSDDCVIRRNFILKEVEND